MPSPVLGAEAPRLYHLHPLLAGTVEHWPHHLDRIARMRFDGVYVSACFAAGPTGAIDVPGQPMRLDPRIAGDRDGSLDGLRPFVDQAAAAKLDVVLEAVLPVTAADGLIADTRSEWIARDEQGSPRWHGDGLVLALDADHEAQLEHFDGLLRAYLETGARGLRFAAAHRVPAAFWRRLLEPLADAFPKAWFIADMLGAPSEDLDAYAGVGFTGVLDSSRWWNFHDAWFLKQQPRLARIGTPFAFPEEGNGPRLAAQLDNVAPGPVRDRLESRYLAAIGLGAGLFMPMGFEYGCKRPLDPKHSSPEDWAAETVAPAIDLTSFVAAANALKNRHEALRQGAELRRVNPPNANTAALVRLSHASPAKAEDAVFVCANPESEAADGIDLLGLIKAAGGRFATLHDITPGAHRAVGADAAGTHPNGAWDSGATALNLTKTLVLEPREVRLLASSAVKQRVQRPGRAAAVEKKIMAMAGHRMVIEKVAPELDGGRFPVKRVVGELLEVQADIFMDGHVKLAANLLVRAPTERQYTAVPMTLEDNDRWVGRAPLTLNGRYGYTIEAWYDVFATWCDEITKKHAARVPIVLELEEGRQLVSRTAAAAEGAAKDALEGLLEELRARPDDDEFQRTTLLDPTTRHWMTEADLKFNLTRYERELEVIVDRTAAAFAAWYELFPRSQSDDPERHGTFDDVIAKLPYVQDMGFDVLYFPPIHPIGRVNRKGRNNTLTPTAQDPGSPYAIGSTEGGHTALHPELGTFDDFARLVDAAHAHGLEIALDLAINCSPDHPWLKEHPEWFDWRPDGSLKYAENPPKKYEDITNVDFYKDGALPSLWLALRDVVLFWVEHGVKTFRVDNPHTKPLPFWEWLIADVQAQHPDTVFLSEAFTRPKMMRRLAKLGFSQSYSYFTWRNHKAEIQEYLTELTQDEPREHMRPNFFVNTPDINPYYLQTSGRAGFQCRAVLAATLSTLWGVYSGFELCEGTPMPGREEYLDSEKYEIKAWDWDRPGHIRADIRLLNQVRRDNPALWSFTNLEFHNAWNDQVLVYSKMTAERDNAVLVAVSLDPHNVQEAAFEVPLWHFGLEDHGSIGVEDLVTGARFTWTGKVQNVRLDPHYRPYQLWRLVPPGIAASSPFADRR